MAPRRLGHHGNAYRRHLEHLAQRVVSKVGSNVRLVPSSTVIVTAISTVLGTFGYVAYRDWRRERRIIDQLMKGSILQPLNRGIHEVRLYPRPSEMAKLHRALRPDVSNQYYLVFGEVGSGKTRLITEVVRDMIATRGHALRGAPVYVLASQGHSFAESLAEAVDFHFDEHISLRFVLDYIFRVGQLPERDEKSKLERVLDALEKAAFRHLEETGRPAVLVIDGADWISKSVPEAIDMLQEKAKMWADTNIIKMVFVSNDEHTEEAMQRNHSAWSRAALPIIIGDLQPDEAGQFLRLHDPVMTKAALESKRIRRQGRYQYKEAMRYEAKNTNDSTPDTKGKGVDITDNVELMPDTHVEKIINLVGGRIQNLLVAKRDWLKGYPLSETSAHLRLKERSKFIEISKSASQRKVIDILYHTPGHKILLRDIIDMTSRDDVFACAFHNVIRIERDFKIGLMVQFESRLTEVVVEEMQQSHYHHQRSYLSRIWTSISDLAQRFF